MATITFNDFHALVGDTPRWRYLRNLEPLEGSATTFLRITHEAPEGSSRIRPVYFGVAVAGLLTPEMWEDIEKIYETNGFFVEVAVHE